MRKISTGSGVRPRRLGEESGKPDRNNDYNKAHFGLRIYVCPAETVQLGVSCVVGLLLTQNFNGVWCQSLKTQGGERGNSTAVIITTKCISVYKYISVLTKLDNSACAYCGIVARTKFQQGLASVLKDTGRREGKLNSNNNYNKVYFSLQIYIYISDLLKLYDSACLYCGIVARTKFQQGLVSVLEDMGRRQRKTQWQ